VTGDEFSEVDFDLLADYVGGALDGTPEHATVVALIAAEPAWRAAHDELAQGMAAVGAALGALGATAEPMPAEVATRLDEAFAAAGPAAEDEELGAPGGRRLTSVPADASEPRRSPVRNRGREKRGRRLRWAAPIAAAAAALAFVGFGIDYLAGRGQEATSDSAASSGAGRAENAPMIATDQAPASGAGVTGLPPAAAITSSGTDYLPTTLAGATTDNRKAAPAPGEAATASAADPLARLRPAAALLACLQAIGAEHGGGPITVQSVDYARFAGTPAVVARFTAADGTWAWASGSTCGTPGIGAATLDRAKVG
jgi:hypothetical protein